MDKGRHQLQRKEGTCTLCSMTRAALAGVLLTATLATVASGCGDSKTYSQGHVVVLSKGGLDPEQRKRLTLALKSLH